MSEDERKKLNLIAGRLIERLGICIHVTENTFDVLREKCNAVGYAHYYLYACYDESELTNKAKIEAFKKLLEIDTKLGTTQSEQFIGCVMVSFRIDLITVIEVRYFFIIKFKLL